jgi:uncharacterized protein YecT (DUF1311 family)
MVRYGFALALIALCACNREAPVRTRDDIAADSALAADLALANRDTLAIDSIGLPAPATKTPADTDLAGSLEGKARPAAPAPAPAPTPAPAPPAPVIAPAPTHPAVTAPPAAPPSAPRPTPRRRAGDACNSPVRADQEACVHTLLAAADMRMNRNYRALITEMRRQEGIKPGQKDPASVDRLRVAQRAWVVYRDTECRRRGRETEGALWARPRVKCLAEFSTARANELADNFTRLMSH